MGTIILLGGLFASANLAIWAIARQRGRVGILPSAQPGPAPAPIGTRIRQAIAPTSAEAFRAALADFWDRATAREPGTPAPSDAEALALEKQAKALGDQDAASALYGYRTGDPTYAWMKE